ncbi:MAG: response regulator [Bacillota bacterium]|nr:response regulator [Bacillota bacterium]
MLKVMIVDDMDIIRRQVRRLKLWGEKTGFIISDEAGNGHEAIAKLEESPVDLVITDVRMPKVDGLELLRKLVERNLCPCVILLSDYSDFNYVRQGLVLGAFDYMKKPVEEEEFGKVLMRAKEFIQAKKKEQGKLLQKLDEQAEGFLYEAGVKQIVELVGAGETRVTEAAAELIERIGKVLEYDLIKIESMLGKAMEEIAEAILEKYKWLGKFITEEELKKIDFTAYGEFEKAKGAFTQALGKADSYLNKLRNGQHTGGLVEQVSHWVLENIDGEISLKAAADALFVNKTYLSEAFKQKTRISFVEYATQVKMERAKKLMREGSLKIYEIGDRLGFKDVEYFSKLFKRYTTMTPSEYRQNKS